MDSNSINTALHTFRSPKLKSVVKEAIEFLLRTPVHNLPPQGGFEGVGVYVIYYRGTFNPYCKIAELNQLNCTTPIYVGKAVPPGWRTARTASVKKYKTLQNRLNEHARSISQSNNLLIKDFLCRFMILNGTEIDLITAIEAQLIRNYKPLWNAFVDGFGNHDPGSGRYNQAKSEWDVIHPGRIWAGKLTGVSPKIEYILAKVRKVAIK